MCTTDAAMPRLDPRPKGCAAANFDAIASVSRKTAIIAFVHGTNRRHRRDRQPTDVTAVTVFFFFAAVASIEPPPSLILAARTCKPRPFLPTYRVK